jgi:type VI secretion system protein ImpB
MAKEGSVAPKERVNIVYRPATGDAKEEVELPLKLLIVGDFTMRPDERMIEERKPINIDKDNFNEVLKAQNLNLDLTVPNKLSGEPDEEMSVSLKFESIKDFDPEAIARNSTELSKLLELREALKALKGPMSNRPEFRKKIQELIKDDAAREQILNELKVEEE